MLWLFHINTTTYTSTCPPFAASTYVKQLARATVQINASNLYSVCLSLFIQS